MSGILGSFSTQLRYTLCFLTRGDLVLMLHRQKPPNMGLWNGVGGRLEVGETPRQSVLREVHEETGFLLSDIRFAGLLTWDGFETPDGGLYIFTAQAPPGEPAECSEGRLEWKPRAWVFSSPEVVSNIPLFAPLIFAGESLKRYHFSYWKGQIRQFTVEPLPPGLAVDGPNIGE